MPLQKLDYINEEIPTKDKMGFDQVTFLFFSYINIAVRPPYFAVLRGHKFKTALY